MEQKYLGTLLFLAYYYWQSFLHCDLRFPIKSLQLVELQHVWGGADKSQPMLFDRGLLDLQWRLLLPATARESLSYHASGYS